MSSRLFVLCGVLLVSGAQAGTVEDWALLDKVAQAARGQTLSGSYLHQIGAASETFRIQRAVSKGQVRERRISLDGLPREIIRHGDALISAAPDARSLLAAKISSAKLFPAIFPENAASLADSYTLTRLGSDRVASRACLWLQLKPLQSEQRYVQRVCIDKVTKLPLKLVTLGARQEMVEAFSFIDLDFRTPSETISVRPSYKLSSKSAAAPVEMVAESESLDIKGIPQGFQLLREVVRKMPGAGGAEPARHLVYSDGLVMFSLFVEHADDARPAPALTHGPISVVTDDEGEYRLTLVGDLPEAGLLAIARHIRIGKKT